MIQQVKPAEPYQMLILTQDGAGAAVAAGIDASDWEDLIGTVAGYSSVLLLTENKFYQDLLMYRLKFFRDEYGPEEEEDAAESES